MSAYPEQLDLNSLDEDEGDLTEDDEVFTRGGKPYGEENGVNKPLMAPRHPHPGGRGKESLQTKVRRVPPIRVIWAPLMYGLVALGAVIGIIVLIVFVINTFLEHFHLGSGQHSRLHPLKHLEVKPTLEAPPQACSNLSVEDVWAQTFPMLTTESALRLLDVNKDGVQDILLGFGTGADAFSYPLVVCEVYFSGSRYCGGGLLALDGQTGKELWRHYTPHEIFALNCNVDIDLDGVNDCLAAGRMAGLVAVSGAEGRALWTFSDKEVIVPTSNVYTPLNVRDLDNDNVPDFVVVHGGDPMKEAGSRTRLVGRLLVMSSRTGQVLQWALVPDKKESYYSPQLLVHPDGSEYVLFGTGGETHGGALWCIDLNSLLSGNIQQAKAIYSDLHKGVMTPPVLVDLTGDGVTDIVMAMFNSTVIAFNGLTFEQLWNTRFPSSESYSTPGVGFFNQDSVPDFIVNYQTGPGFPIYYYTQTTILDGSNGRPLLPQPVRMVVGTQSSPLVASVEGLGNDIFLYWVSDCHGDHANRELEFGFVPGTSVHEQSRSDFCKSRFKESLYARMYAMNRLTDLPGTVLYDSDARKSQEFGHQLNYTDIGQQFLRDHPQIFENARDNEEEAQPQESEPAQTRYDSHNIQGGMRRYPGGLDPRYGPPETDQQWRNGYPRDYNEGAYPLLPEEEEQQPQDLPWPQQPTSDSYSSKGYQRKRGRNFSRAQRRGHHFSRSRLKKRHVGPHDGGGIQRTISTGTLAPVLEPGGGGVGQGVDLVFATFWFYPARTQTILPQDGRCIQARLRNEAERFQVTSAYYKMDHDEYVETITRECLEKSGHFISGLDTSTSGYNPFDRQMGQMTVYRLRLDCRCPSEVSRCARILPFAKQGWPAYMGRAGNSLYVPHH